MNNWQERRGGDKLSLPFSQFSLNSCEYFEELIQKYPDTYTPTEIKKNPETNYHFNLKRIGKNEK